MKPGCGGAGPALGSWGYGYTGCTGTPVMGISWPGWGTRTGTQGTASLGRRPHPSGPGVLLPLPPDPVWRVQQCAQRWPLLVGLGSVACPARVSETSWARQHWPGGRPRPYPGPAHGRPGLAELSLRSPPTLTPTRGHHSHTHQAWACVQAHVFCTWSALDVASAPGPVHAFPESHMHTHGTQCRYIHVPRVHTCPCALASGVTGGQVCPEGPAAANHTS